MPTFNASAEWEGTFKDGRGAMRVESGAFEAPMSPKPEQGKLTNPEEVVGSSLAGCYSLVLSKALEQAGHKPGSIRTKATVDLEGQDGKFRIPRIGLDVQVEAQDLDDESRLQELAEQADQGCPVSQALSGTKIEINAQLAGAGARA